jgi:hypothetical protein
MTTMIAEVYEAFRSAGAKGDKACAAATAIAEDNRDIREVKSYLALLKWMVGFNLAFALAVLWRVFV